MNVAQLLIQCLEDEYVDCNLGISSEENIRLVDVIAQSLTQFVSVSHEQGMHFIVTVVQATFRSTLAEDTISLIACPVGYSEDMKLTDTRLKYSSTVK